MQNEFDDKVQVVHTSIQERLDNYRDILRGSAGLFAASRSVERNEFHAYVNSMHLDQVYPGIQGVGFAQLIPAREKKRQIDAVRREGFPNFSIQPEGVRDRYTAVIYLEPFDWRIIAAADVVEAMFSHRPYRPALGVDAALAEIIANRGVLYNPDVVDACVRLFRERGYSFIS